MKTIFISLLLSMLSTCIQAQQEALYLSCGNKVFLSAEKYGIPPDSFRVEVVGADIEKGKQKDSYLLIPNRSKVAVQLFNEEQLIETILYPVRATPKPSLVVRIDGNVITPEQAVDFQFTNGSLSLEVEAEEEFKLAVPDDTHYQVTKFVVTLARGKKAIAWATYHKPAINLGILLDQAQLGDRLVFEIKEIKRMDYKEMVRRVPNISATIFTLRLR